jgi:hypothetical protein
MEFEVTSDLVAGKRVLLVWQGGNSGEATQKAVEALRGKVGASGEVLLEHVQRLQMG